MSAATASSTETATVHVRLPDEGVDGWLDARSQTASPVAAA